MRRWGVLCLLIGILSGVVGVRPAQAAKQRTLRELAPAAADAAKNRRGYVGVAVYDLDTDQLYTFQPERRFRMYSTVKVAIMLAVLDRVVREERRATTREQAMITAMIQRSDNAAATTLLGIAGGAVGVEAFLRRNNIVNTTINGVAWGASTTTAPDMARLLARLANCVLLVERLCRYAQDVMRGVVSWQAWGVSGGVPAVASVALKNGWYPDPGGWTVNSMGIVQNGNVRYTIAVFTFPDPSMAYGIATIEQISMAVYAGSR